MADDHESLIGEATSGSETAIDQLLERHMPGLLAFIRLHAGKRIRMRESCSDLAQSVCREVLVDLDAFEYRGEAEFKHWLYTKAMRKIFERARFNRAQKRDVAREARVTSPTHAETASLSQIYVDVVTPSRVAMGREDVLRFEEAFDQLPDDYRQVISLSRVVGLSHRQIADVMGRTVGATRALLRRAVSRLCWVMSGRAAE